MSPRVYKRFRVIHKKNENKRDPWERNEELKSHYHLVCWWGKTTYCIRSIHHWSFWHVIPMLHITSYSNSFDRGKRWWSWWLWVGWEKKEVVAQSSHKLKNILAWTNQNTCSNKSTCGMLISYRPKTATKKWKVVRKVFGSQKLLFCRYIFSGQGVVNKEKPNFVPLIDQP